MVRFTSTFFFYSTLLIAVFCAGFTFEKKIDNDPVEAIRNNIDSLFSLSTRYISVDNDIANIYAGKAKALLSEIDYPEGLVTYYLLKVRIAYYHDDYNEAFLFLDSITPIIDFQNISDNLAKYYGHHAMVHCCLGNYEEAAKWVLKTIEVHKSLGNYSGLGMTYNSMGNIYMEQNDQGKAETYFKKAIETGKNGSNSVGYSYTLVAMGKLKLQQDSLELAHSYFQDAYNINIKNGGLRGIALTLYYNAQIETRQGNYIDALKKLDESIEIYLQLEEKYGQTFVYNQFSETYRLAGNLNRAIESGKKANHLAGVINCEPLLAKSYLMLSEAHVAKNDYEPALKDFQAYEKLNTKLISWENNKRIASMEHQSQMLSKEKDIELLENTNRNKTMLVYFLVPILFLVLLASVVVFMYFRVKNKNLLQKQVILEEKNRIVEIENELQKQKQKVLKNDLELKNRELTSKALGLLHLNETLRDIGEKINEIKPENNGFDSCDKNQLIKEIQLATHSNIWEEFDHAFKQVHNSFYEKLLDKCPNLSSTEIKIAALLRLNLSTKEIASISFKSESAVKIARHRIRNKLELGSNENLISYLLKL